MAKKTMHGYSIYRESHTKRNSKILASGVIWAMMQGMADTYILGIETSCDETAAAIIDGGGRVMADVRHSQIATHQPHGGVVPELAAREHISVIDGVIRQALFESKLTASQLTAVAATAGPGLIGGVVVGCMVATGMATALGIPYYAINHLEGHALMARLSEAKVRFPYLLLLVSGGHTQLLAVEGVGTYRLYGETLDDAAGEAFDKSAKALGLPMPGGPSIEQAARGGDPHAFPLPRPLMRRAGCDFSFSGLKTAVVMTWRDLNTHADAKKHHGTAQKDLAASVQQAIADCLVSRCVHGMQRFMDDYEATQPYLVVSGGVAANQVIRQALTTAATKHGFLWSAPPIDLCTDNGVMIAWAARERILAGVDSLPQNLPPRPRWSLANLNETISHA